MPSLLSSAARLTNADAIRLFKQIFAQHGALTRPGTNFAPSQTFTQEERLTVVPLVFGLMPAEALDRQRYNRPPPLKPLIRDHLAAIGLSAADEDLIDILQNVIYHYTSTLSFPYRSKLTKRSIGDVRQNATEIYKAIIKRQNGRCAVCGAVFAGGIEETLDHVLPWRLVGDPRNGANWQVLCRPCNNGKQHWLSSIQAPQSLNWWYGCPEEQLTDAGATEETRFILLTQRPACEMQGCSEGPLDAALYVVKRHSSGLAVADNLRVLCQFHC